MCYLDLPFLDDEDPWLKLRVPRCCGGVLVLFKLVVIDAR